MRFLCLCLLLCLVANGCHRQPVELTFAVGGTPTEVEWWERLLEGFRRDTGLRVRLLRQPTDTDQRRQHLVVALRARQPDPDVFLMDVAWVAQMAASGWLESLEPYLRRSDLDPKRLLPQVVQQVDRWRGKLVALPVYIDCGLLYWRTDLLSRYGCEVPRTWEQLVRCALRVQRGERRHNPRFWGFLWQGAQYEGLVTCFLEFAASRGGGLVDAGGRLRLDDPRNAEALTFMRDLIHRWRISPPNTYTEMREEEVRLAFQRGDALFERNWPYAWALHQEPDSPVRGKVGLGLLPAFTGGRPVAALGGWHIGISRYSDCKTEAWQLVAFVLSRGVQARLARELGWNPSRVDLYQGTLRGLEHLQVVGRACALALARPSLPWWPQLSAVLQRFLNAALAGRMEPAQALRQAQGAAKRLARLYGGALP